MNELISTGKRFMYKIKHDFVNAFSAQAALFILISIFPIIMTLLNLIQFVPVTKTDFLRVVVEILPASFSALAVSIIEDLYLKSSGTLLSLSAVLTIWSASRGTMAIVNGLNSVYDIEETRNYLMLRLVSCFYTIGFILMILFTLMLLVFGNSLYSMIAARLPILHALAATLISMRTLLALVVLVCFFGFIYTVLPSRKARFSSQLPGALFSAAGWMTFSFFFSIYIDNFSNYSYMYGSLATIVLLMLWLYFCMYILFLGGEINAFFEPVTKQLLAYFRMRHTRKK
ncbi:MAG: YihY/virulence factor BrkB family protein [Lachnospiraceae bacterium]|nr:YihY/virulence factor BrkB family protein [Lachnospiraceae bacterium]